MSTPASPMTQNLQRALSEGARIINTFAAPSKTFSDIRRSARWYVPWLLMAVLGCAFSYTVQKQIGWEQIQQTQVRLGPAAQREQIEKMPPAQREQQMRIGLKITKFFGYAFPTIFSILWLAIVALVLWATFSFGAGVVVRYGQALAIVMYASLPTIIKSMMGIAVLMAGVDPDNFIIQNPVGTNPGYYMNIDETPRFLYGVASGLDPIMFWVLFLTALGFVYVGKAKKGTAMAIVFGWYAVFVLASSGLGAMFS
jgi:hypothetical protein